MGVNYKGTDSGLNPDLANPRPREGDDNRLRWKAQRRDSTKRNYRTYGESSVDEDHAEKTLLEVEAARRQLPRCVAGRSLPINDIHPVLDGRHHVTSWRKNSVEGRYALLDSDGKVISRGDDTPGLEPPSAVFDFITGGVGGLAAGAVKGGVKYVGKKAAREVAEAGAANGGNKFVGKKAAAKLQETGREGVRWVTRDFVKGDDIGLARFT